MSDAPPDAYERVRAYISERTAVPGDMINAVLEAQEEFWRQYPALVADAADLVKQADAPDA